MKREHMRLERYNQIVIALTGTGALLGGIALLVILALSAFGSSEQRGVIVDVPNTEKPPQNLVFCPPLNDATGAYEYIPVGVVVANDAEQDPLLSVASYGRARSYFDGCAFDGAASRTFNVVIRELGSGAQRLLLDEPAQISSLEMPDAECAAGKGQAPCGLLLWFIRSEDSNRDGRINGDDALGAYVSDLAASALTSLTPVDATLLDSQWAPQTNKWQLQIRRDSNKDGRYTAEDGSELLEAETSASATGRPFIQQQVLYELRKAAQ
jgi:hypothetical protein